MRRFLKRVSAFFSAIPASAIVWALLTTATGIALLSHRRHLILQLHVDVARLLSWVTANHPLLARAVHIAKDITPDVSILLLALAGLGYLMPDQVKRIESSKALRRIVASVFFVFAALTIVLNEVDRIDKDNKQQEVSGTLREVSSTEGEILKDILEDKDMPEVERRKHVLRILRDEYVRSHSNISAGILSGDEPLPADWTNHRLRELGQSWTVSAEVKAPTLATQRSYVTFDGLPIFVGSTIPKTEGGDFKAGDELAFNVYFKATGPNPIQLISQAWELFIEPEFSAASENTAVDEFLVRTNREIKRLTPPASPQTMMPGDRHFNTAYGYASAESLQQRVLAQQDLDDLHTGRSVIFIVAQITYKDNGRTHHLRRCGGLQPPATPPGIWHFCRLFNDSE
jgi:hypothetical protein